MTHRPATGGASILGIAALCFVSLTPAAGAQDGCAESGAPVRLNQLAFEATAPKRAIMPSGAASPTPFRVLDERGTVVLEGESRVFGADPLAGETVHQLDFSAVDAPGQGYRVAGACGESHPFAIEAAPWAPLARDALAYFYHHRAGVPIEALNAGGDAWARPAAHVDEVATCRTGRDPAGNDWPGCDYELDVTGGWYDAGDHGKYVVNGGIATWTLANFVERQTLLQRPGPFRDGAARIPEAGNGVDDLLDEARYELEFLLRMQAPDGAVARVPVGVQRPGPDLAFDEIDASGMAHHKVADEEWTALPTAPHEAPTLRLLYPVSTAATLNLSATAAQGARLWREIDPAFAERSLAAARRAWAAAQRNPAVYFVAGFSGSGLYGDGDVSDEFFWAAAELLATTGEAEFAEAVRTHDAFTAPLERQPAWPRTAALGLITLALHGDPLPGPERARVRGLLIAAADRFADERNETGYHIPRNEPRWAWGSNSDLLNRALLMALAHDFTGEARYRHAVMDVMDYLLGRNPLDRSFIAGYGERPMENPHHRFWAPSFDQGHPPPYPGALSGGPNNSAMIDPVARRLRGQCAALTCWADDVEAYALNEVAINWNAPLVWVTGWLADTGAP